MRDREKRIRRALWDIVDWGERLMDHVEGRTEEEFRANRLLQDAACRCIEVIGEASRRLMELDPTLPARHPELALREAYAARNRIVHGYDGIDYGIVLAAARHSVPRMVAAARAVIPPDPA
ncbi:HepT-like ribonuclease domain-containing protein [Paracraurococcus lichenis]|uniref:DUF86 domain-containing protein n=1 Tax=Paracraurococcus lichenis TaxID=3064888 RepID=A0ABT9E7D8_9PROT|nr:HepT-like ribonuclease domain-containing protein [Paracraurococcus sp. LOR1-02]MDO9712089.1 DUF86 domain-containing protein [Paracraurococcus sp. LOR1-02]